MKIKLLSLFFISAMVLMSCKENKSSKEETTETEKQTSSLDKPLDQEFENVEDNPLFQQYPRVPESTLELRRAMHGEAVYGELKQRFTTNFKKLKTTIDQSGAKLVILIMNPAATKGMLKEDREDISFLQATATNEGLDVINLTSFLNKTSPQEMTQIPKDGHWSKKGSEVLANELAKYLPKYFTVKSTTTYPERPSTFNDLDPNQDQVLDGGKDLPYHLVTNSQGLRQNYELEFPKTKQRILFMGDSEIYSPFLDNEQIVTYLLQQKFPEREIVNASVIGYTLEDYISLYNEKTKYVEPDVVVLTINPGDILDFFFAQRNKMARKHNSYHPTENEKKLYNVLYGKLNDIPKEN